MKMVLSADHVGNKFVGEGEFNHVMSNDKKFMLLVSSEWDKENSSRTLSQCVLYSDSMTVVWKGLLSLGDTEDSRLVIDDMAVSNDGKVILVTSVDKKRKEWRSNPEYRILIYNLEGELVAAENMDSGGRVFREIAVDFDSNGDLICAGFYSNEDHWNTLKNTVD